MALVTLHKASGSDYNGEEGEGGGEMVVILLRGEREGISCDISNCMRQVVAIVTMRGGRVVEEEGMK